MSPTEPNATLSVVILAAGAGMRMKSGLPKPLHTVGGCPMLAQVLSVAREIGPMDITIVGSQELNRHLQSDVWAEGVSLTIQSPPRGTADAVRAALEAGASGSTLIVLYADHPLVTSDVLSELTDVFDPALHN